MTSIILGIFGMAGAVALGLLGVFLATHIDPNPNSGMHEGNLLIIPLFLLSIAMGIGSVMAILKGDRSN
jgi:hypothetical protein